MSRSECGIVQKKNIKNLKNEVEMREDMCYNYNTLMRKGVCPFDIRLGGLKLLNVALLKDQWPPLKHYNLKGLNNVL